jgi:two-component system, NtrC family, sensor kinase
MSSPVTELQQMASAGRLLAGVIHEINSPLGSIFSNNEVISRSLEILDALLANGSPESLEKAARIIETCRNLAAVDRIACERIRSVIRGLKSFVRVDAGERRAVNLSVQLRDTLKLAHAAFGRRITVESDLDDLPEVECYPQMLNQVFLNLLVNAGQAIDGEGRITVRSRLEDGWVHVSIADTGRGMSPEAQARAFEVGFTTKPVGEGIGIGLSIAKEVVEERHGGSIRFESQPGVGTTFHVRIPVRRTKELKL